MGFRRKYMHNHAAVIQQHPAVAVMAFGAQHVHACAAQLEVRLVCQRAHMGGGIAGCDHEIIRYRGQVFHMQDADIITFFRVQRAGQTDGKFFAFHSILLCCRIYHSDGVLSPSVLSPSVLSSGAGVAVS